MNSLYKRLLAWLLASLGLLWLVVGFAVYVTVRTSLEGRFDSELKAMAAEVWRLFPDTGRKPDAKPPGYWIEFLQEDSGLYFEIWDEFMLFSDRSPSLGREGLPRPAAAGEGPYVWNFTLASGEKVRGLAQPFPLPPTVRPGGREAGNGTPYAVHVVVARNRDALDRSLQILLAATGMVGLLMIPVSFLIVRGGVGRGLRPLKAFATHVASFGFHSLGERLPTSGVPHELIPIAQRLNELMDRLKQGVDRERRLNADLAHELRTPVAELTTMAEVALAWPDQITAEDYRNVLGAARQMQSIIENMLLLARWDRDPVRPAREEVRLAEAVSRCWSALAEKAVAKRLAVQQAVSPDTVWRTNPDLLQIILGNLLANAVEYSPEGGFLRIEVRGQGAAAELAVANAVDDLEARDVPFLFERFWRRSAARSGAGHAGLGLSLAKSCADLLDLELRAEYSESPRSLLLFVTPRSGEGRCTDGRDPSAEKHD